MLACIFDLDGVITRTARLHEEAWKQTFDAMLQRRAVAAREAFVAFTVPGDYRRYVDGKPRYQGAAAFLTSRGIHLPWGETTDAPGDASVCAVGNAKNAAFAALIERRGVEVDAAAVRFVAAAHGLGIRTAVATSSRNGRHVLRRAGLIERFDVVVDGTDAAALELPGKPDPALFLHAAHQLGVGPDDAAVFEDSTAGIQAAKAGRFSLVVGIGASNREALLRAGADTVVGGFEDLRLTQQRQLLATGRPV